VDVLKAAGYSVVLNPGRDSRIAFPRGDRVVVLAERQGSRSRGVDAAG
jgi:hypothetical protein